MNFNAQDLVRIRVNGKLVKGFPETGPNKRGISRRGMAANAGGEFRRDSDVNSTALLADSGGDK